MDNPTWEGLPLTVTGVSEVNTRFGGAWARSPGTAPPGPTGTPVEVVA